MRARLASLSAESRETFWRSLQTLNGTRAIIAVVLLAYLSLGANGSVENRLRLELCVLYLAASLGFVLAASYWQRRFMLQLVVQLACDIGVISMLYLADGGMRSGLAILYLFPLAGCAILAPLLVALFFASTASLVLLAEAAYRAFAPGGELVLLVQAGLYGAAGFATVVVVNRMAARLIGQEELAVQRGLEIGVHQPPRAGPVRRRHPGGGRRRRDPYE